MRSHGGGNVKSRRESNARTVTSGARATRARELRVGGQSQLGMPPVATCCGRRHVFSTDFFVWTDAESGWFFF